MSIYVTNLHRSLPFHATFRGASLNSRPFRKAVSSEISKLTRHCVLQNVKQCSYAKFAGLNMQNLMKCKARYLSPYWIMKLIVSNMHWNSMWIHIRAAKSSLSSRNIIDSHWIFSEDRKLLIARKQNSGTWALADDIRHSHFSNTVHNIFYQFQHFPRIITDCLSWLCEESRRWCFVHFIKCYEIVVLYNVQRNTAWISPTYAHL